MKAAFIYTDAYLHYDYGPIHPLRISRLQLTYDLIQAYHLLDLPSCRIPPTIKAVRRILNLPRQRIPGRAEEGSDGHLSRNPYAFGLGPEITPSFPVSLNGLSGSPVQPFQAVDYVAKWEREVAFNIAEASTMP
jgi:acetoin utilization protein AcuC